MEQKKHTIRYGSVCSGVEAATLAWAPLGWECKFVSEVEPFPCAVLQQRFDATKPLRPLDPEEASDDADRAMRKAWGNETNKLPDGGTLPNLGDFTKIRKDDYDGDIDLLVGGTPCQDLSIAGQRAGFEGARSGLAIDFVRLAYELGTRWLVWENVPGALSSNGGGDFATLLSILTGREVGVPEGGFGTAGFVCNARRDRFGLAWRVLDAQYVRVPEFPRAVPQRRRRIFLIGYLGSWEYPVQVLFDGEMRGGYTPPSRTKRQGTPADSQGGSDATKSIRMRGGKPGGGKGALIGNDLSHTLGTGNDQTIVSIQPEKPIIQCVDTRQVEAHETEISPTLTATDYKGGKAVYGIGRDVFNASQNAKYGLGLGDDVQPTMTSRGPGAVCYENNPTDSRIKETTVSPTCVARWGTGGNNMPLVQRSDGDIASTLVATMFTKNTSDDCTKLITEQNPVGFIKNDAGGEQQGFWNEAFPTLRSGALPAVAYNVTFCDANGTRKDRPEGGLYVTEADASKTVTAGGSNAETVVIDSVAIAENIIGRQDHTGGNGVGAQEELAYTQNATGVMGVATMECIPLDLRNATRDPEKHDEQNRQGIGVGEDGAPMNTITTGSVPGVGWKTTVRRLLPIECERLMGFPDNHTRISWKGKPPEDCPDAPRYKACGNSMAVNVMAWIGHRIQEVEERIQEEKK